MGYPFGMTGEATWKFLVSRLGFAAELGHSGESTTLSGSCLLAGSFSHLSRWNHPGAYGKDKQPKNGVSTPKQKQCIFQLLRPKYLGVILDSSLYLTARIRPISKSWQSSNYAQKLTTSGHLDHFHPSRRHYHLHLYWDTLLTISHLQPAFPYSLFSTNQPEWAFSVSPCPISAQSQFFPTSLRGNSQVLTMATQALNGPPHIMDLGPFPWTFPYLSNLTSYNLCVFPPTPASVFLLILDAHIFISQIQVEFYFLTE